MIHLHLLIFLVDDFFPGQNVVDVCHGPIENWSWLMQIVSRYHCTSEVNVNKFLGIEITKLGS